MSQNLRGLKIFGPKIRGPKILNKILQNPIQKVKHFVRGVENLENKNKGFKQFGEKIKGISNFKALFEKSSDRVPELIKSDPL